MRISMGHLNLLLMVTIIIIILFGGWMDGAEVKVNDSVPECPLQGTGLQSCDWRPRKSFLFDCNIFVVNFTNISALVIQPNLDAYQTGVTFDGINGDTIKGSCFISSYFATKRRYRPSDCYMFKESNGTDIQSHFLQYHNACHCVCWFESSPELKTGIMLFKQYVLPQTTVPSPVVCENDYEDWTNEISVDPQPALKTIATSVHVENPRDLQKCRFRLFKIAHPEEFTECGDGFGARGLRLIRNNTVDFKENHCSYEFENLTFGNYCIWANREPRPLLCKTIVTGPVTLNAVLQAPYSIRPPEFEEAVWEYPVMGAVIAIFTLLMFAVLKYRQWRRSAQSDPDPIEDENTSAIDFSQTKVKEVFLLRDDGDNLDGVMEHLKKFLETYFRFKVLYQGEHSHGEIMQNRHHYIERMLKSDVIVVINSKDAFEKCESYLNQRTTSPSIMIDILNRIKHSDEYDYKRVVHVRFPFTMEKHLITAVVPSKHYLIPDDLEDFVRHVHGTVPDDDTWSRVREDSSYAELRRIVDRVGSAEKNVLKPTSHSCTHALVGKQKANLPDTVKFFDELDEEAFATDSDCRSERFTGFVDGRNDDDGISEGFAECAEASSSEISPVSSDIDFGSRTELCGQHKSKLRFFDDGEIC